MKWDSPNFPHLKKRLESVVHCFFTNWSSLKFMYFGSPNETKKIENLAILHKLVRWDISRILIRHRPCHIASAFCARRHKVIYSGFYREVFDTRIIIYICHSRWHLISSRQDAFRKILSREFLFDTHLSRRSNNYLSYLLLIKIHFCCLWNWNVRHLWNIFLMAHKFLVLLNRRWNLKQFGS